ncbi:Asp23/Gls24 family envelope stress response protein [Ammoniphilus sp. 3BR4]|uniref:Asp23/Gls24 family envelope stress response protein n=1 Tax=Ammoniphilus sp. 3BR4 TaxID=3158265 RepID=UPI00346675AE
MAEKLEKGIVKIADDVVAVIAAIAAAETEGVASMSGGIVEGFARRVGGKNVHKGVHVEVGEVEAAIGLRVILHYGVKIDEVCKRLQYQVKDAVETMTGLRVVEVNVKVEGVEFKETKPPVLEEIYRLR